MVKIKKTVKFNKLTRTPARSKILQKSFKRVLLSGYYILGTEVNNFENEFARYLGAKYCIGVGNGQEALQISLMALGIKEGDEVITTPVSAVATTLAILAVGAKPVFVDTTSDGLINPDLIPETITKKTKVILPVHLYGNAVDLDRLKNISRKYNLHLIEDACQAHGSEYKGRKLGTFGDFGCFSFYPTKNLGGFGDGGAIVTNSKRLAKLCYEIRDYGQKSQYNHVRYGLNSRLDELQAALLREELRNLDYDNSKRRGIGQRYIKNLSSHPVGEAGRIPLVLGSYTTGSNFHLFVIKSKRARELQNYLAASGIQTLIHYPKTIPDQPFLKKEDHSLQIPAARKFVKTILSLPFHPQMTLREVDIVSQKIIEFFKVRH